MTKNTQNLILEFSKTRNVRLLPSIFIGIQEEDNVAEIISFKNCIKLIRNIAAHEPETLVNQIKDVNNTGCSKLVFKPAGSAADVQKRVVLDIVHFTAWLFDAKLKTGDIAYIVLWQSLLDYLYPDMKRQRAAGSRKFLLFEEAHEGKAVHMFVDLQNFM